MPAQIILTVIESTLKGQKYIFNERTTTFVGRGEDCFPRLPDDKDHQYIGRRHCMLDINPPDIRIRDLGSLNGTYVNKKKIGQRARDQTDEEGAQLQFPEYDLKEGDEIKLGDTVFRVGISVDASCDGCGSYIAEDQKPRALKASGIYLCPACSQSSESLRPTAAPGGKAKVCANCGRDVSAEVDDYRKGDFVCGDCKANPMVVIEQLLKLAEDNDKKLQAIQGYDVLKELGRGGMGAVYLARHIRTDKLVALKVMLPEVAAEEWSREYFLREVENTKALKHRNVVELLDHGFSNGTFFFTLEYCSDGCLESLMVGRGGRLPLDEAMNIILQALDGLDYAHKAEIPYVKLADGTIGRGRGLVHRDIKPPNLFLSRSGGSLIAKIGDYGLAKAFDLAGLGGLTRTGTKAGSPWFMPRQQALNFKYVKPEVDVWAIAATLYYLLTSWVPRDFPMDWDPWRVVYKNDPVPIGRRGSPIPKRLAEVIDQALVEEPEIYFKTAAELKRALESAL